MRRHAYVEGHLPFSDGLEKALRWAGDAVTIHVGDTQSITLNPWLEELGVDITSSSRRSRFYGHPEGVVICAWLNLAEVLEVERNNDVEGIVVLPAHGRTPHVSSEYSGHAPWITAFDAECLGGEPIDHIAEASAPVKATVEGLSDFIVRRQGLIDRRERDGVVQALTYLRARGVAIDPDALLVEALRNEWARTGPGDLRQIAIDLNKGKRLKSTMRISPARLEEWAQST